MRWLNLIAVLVAFCLPSAGDCASDRVTGLALATGQPGPSVYFARGGRLYRAEIANGAADFKAAKGVALEDIGFVLAVARKGETLVITDGARPAIHEYDPRTLSTKPLLRVPERSNLLLVAADDQGQVAAYDGNNDLLFLIGLPGEKLSRAIEIGQVSGLAFSGGALNLLIRGDVYRLEQNVISRTASPVIIRADAEPSLLTQLTSDLRATALTSDEGRLYVATDSDFDVLSKPDQKALRVSTRPPESAGVVPVLAARNRQLAIHEPDSTAVRIISHDRVAAAFSIEAPRNVLASTLDTYEFLEGVESLPIEMFVASRNYPTIRHWLVGDEIIPAIGRVPETDESMNRLATRLCKHNGSLCASDALRAAARQGTSIKFPRVPVRSDIATRRIAVKDTIGAYLEANVPEPQRFTSAYLAQLNSELSQSNPKVIASFDLTIAKEGMLPVSPANRILRPGDIVTSDGKRERVLANIAEWCLIEAPESRPDGLKLQDVESSAAGVDALPVPGLASHRAEIDRVEIEYKTPFTRGMEAGDLTNRIAACLARIQSKEQVALVEQVQNVSGATVRLLDASGKVLRLADKELASMGVSPTSRRDATFDIDYAFSIAYKPVNVAETQPVVLRDMADVTRFKESAITNMRNKGPGTFRLPTPVWRLWALVPPSVLMSKGVDSAGLKSSGIFVMIDEPVKVRSQATIADVTKNRTDLMKSVNYADDRPNSYGNVVIGVVEDGASVRKDHPAFVEQPSGLSIWGDYKSGHFARPKMTAGTGEPSVRSGGSIGKDDHGSHVGAILASLNGKMPGFIRSANLLLIDKGSPNEANLAEMQTAIDDASTNNVQVINFSQAIPAARGDPLVDSLKQRFRDVWMDTLLFVAAAGDGEDGTGNGQGLAGGGDLALIKWSREFKDNIIGVAATDMQGRIMRCEPGSADTSCSNQGKEFVQITAPGDSVWSAGSKQDFVPASGTSMAVPQVSATAAMIFVRSNGSWSPRQVKMRLIYTADFRSEYVRDESVWGGKLNISRALFGLSRTSRYVLTKNPGGERYYVQFAADAELRMNGSGNVYLSDEPRRVITPPSVPMQNVLRLQLDGSNYWVVYYEPRSNTMRIAYSVAPYNRNNIGVIALEKINDSNEPEPVPATHEWLVNGVPWTSIKELVAPAPPAKVRF